jgi:RTX calcium-binding nonapeptide repeat (4 copies)
MSSAFTGVPSPEGSPAERIVIGSRAQAPTGPRLPLAFVVGCVVATLTLALVESAEAERIIGTKGPDRIVGTAKADHVKARRGADRVNGRRGRDRLSGGPGADRLNALDRRRDRAVKGGPGNDFCRIDLADLPRMKSCETVRIGKGGGPGPGQNCISAQEPRLPADGESRGLRRVVRGDVPPVFSDAFYAITITLNASADGLDGNGLPISIEEVCDVPEPMANEAAQLAGGEGVAIIGAATRVFQAGTQLQGAAATTALAGADSVTLRAQLKRPAQWRQDEDGQPVPTFGISRADITD